MSYIQAKIQRSSDKGACDKSLFDFKDTTPELISTSFSTSLELMDGLENSSEIIKNYHIDETYIKKRETFQINPDFRSKNHLEKYFLGEVLKKGEYKSIKGGDRLRLGQTDILILETNDIHGISTTLDISKPVTYICNNDFDHAHETCRICMSTVQESNEIMICPCDCRGTSKYIHISCLKNWLSHKYEGSNKKPGAKFSLFSYKAISCDLCHQVLPWKISIGNEEVDLITFERPENCNYIVIEKVDPSGVRTAAVIRNCPLLKIGRGIDKNIVLHDMSGSREHAHIVFEDGEYKVTDLGSKYGTEIEITENRKVDLRNQSMIKFKGYLMTLEMNCYDQDTEKNSSIQAFGDDYQNFSLNTNEDKYQEEKSRASRILKPKIKKLKSKIIRREKKRYLMN